MRLKRIEMAGFKSFVDPTKIDLDKGITAIVGPNGCGKSNIVDALRWVLGEHSAKHLRGGVMEDLIFQGSDSRSPVAVCDVELTFAIQKGSLATPYHELDEVRVRRRLVRDGGSDAFINGKMVRLKDVVDLFLDTGISTRAYAIVEQGSIARMVTAKPEERRVIFEEAAGVMKYRSRRREAERRMKDTRQNLDRVLDLLEEVRSQCRSLKQQASRAGRFKKMQDEFSQLQSLSLGLRYQSLQQDFKEIELQLLQVRVSEEKAGSGLTAAEMVVVGAREDLLCHESEAQIIQDRLRDAEQKKADMQRQLERAAGERRLLKERTGVLESRINEAARHLSSIGSEFERVEQQFGGQSDSELQSLRLEAVQSVKAGEQLYRQQAEKRNLLLSEFERLRHSGEQVRQQKETAGAALLRLHEREQRLGRQLQELGLQCESNAQVLEQAKMQLGLSEQAFKNAESEALVAQTKLNECKGVREAQAILFSEQESAVRERNGVVQELRGRIKHQDVSDELRDGLRARGAIWIDESLTVPEGLEAAVAAALRGRSADVRIPATNPDQQCRDEVLALAEDAPIALFTGGANGQPASGQSLALEMALSPEHPLYDLFVPISLYDDIADAIDGNSYAVSRDGWRFEPGGWLVPPAGNRTARRMATQRKLREAEARLLKEETLLNRVVDLFRQVEEALESQQKRSQQSDLAVTRSESEWHRAISAVERLQAEADSLSERQQRLRLDLKDDAGEGEHWQQQLEQAGVVDQAALVAAEQRLAEQDVAVSSAERSLNQSRASLAQADQSLALFAQARDSLLRESGRLKQEGVRLSEQQDGDRKRLQQAQLELEKACSQSGLDKLLAKAAESVEAIHSAMNVARQKGHELQQAQHESERMERHARQQLQQASSRRQSVELVQAQQATRLQDLTDEIMQRCQLGVDDLLQAIVEMETTDDVESITARAQVVEERLSRFGPVNLLAIEEFEQAGERETFLSEQATDLEASLATLGDTIARIDRTTRQRFRDVFDQTNALFQQTFPQLFGGGRAELRLDSDDILTAGVEVIAQPPGKRLQDVTLLSGGEKALTAVALVFAIFKIKPAPFCVLDEVDAPLDDANVGRFGEMVRELSDRVQFLSISHNKITMQQADRLVGVSMPEPGVSKIVAVDMSGLPDSV